MVWRCESTGIDFDQPQGFSLSILEPATRNVGNKIYPSYTGQGFGANVYPSASYPGSGTWGTAIIHQTGYHLLKVEGNNVDWEITIESYY